MFFKNILDRTVSVLTTEKNTEIKVVDLPLTNIVTSVGKIQNQLFVYQDVAKNEVMTYLKEFEIKRPDDQIQQKYDKLTQLLDNLGKQQIPDCNNRFKDSQNEILVRTKDSIEKLKDFFKESEERKQVYDKKNKVLDEEISKKIIEMEEELEEQRTNIDEDINGKMEDIKSQYSIE